MATIFKKAGYATAAIGKWHLGLGDRGGIDWNKPIPHTPNDIGFDESFIMPATSDRVPCVYLRNGRVLNLSPDDPLEVNYQHKIGNLPTGKENPELLRMRYSHGHYMTIVNGISRIGYQSGGVSALWKDEDIADDFVREARSFIGRHKDTPFFLYLATNNIHVPRMPHPRFQGKSAQGWRGDSILELDATVGAVMRTLDSLHLTEKTIVIFSSDNGPVLDDGYIDDAVAKTGAHNPFWGMRGGKYSTYQAGTRIPFIVPWKGKLHKQRSEALLSQVDFLGSISEALHVPYEVAPARDTQPHWASWVGKDKKGRTYAVQEGLRNVLAVLKGKYKYIEPTAQTMKRAWETGIETGFEGAPQLYDLSVDPAERHNIAGRQPALVKEFEAVIRGERGRH